MPYPAARRVLLRPRLARLRRRRGRTRLARDNFAHLRLTVAAGRAYVRLGLPDRFTEVTAQARAGAHHREAFYRADEALAVVRSAEPDLDRVVALTRDGLRLAGPFQTAHVGSRVDVVLTSAEPRSGYPAVRELTEEARTWLEDRSSHPGIA